MKSGMSSQPLAVIDLVLEKVIDQGDGTWTAEANGLLDPEDGQHKYGTVSVQDREDAKGNPIIEWRQIGANGSFERFLKLDAKTVLFSPRGTRAYVFAFAAGLLNT